MKGKWIAVVFIVVAAIAVLVWADAATTTVYFNTPSTVSFTITLPGEAAATTPTADIEFNSTDTSATKINATVTNAGDAQTDVVPIFTYTNTGNVGIKITLLFGAALPAQVKVKAGLNNSAWQTWCNESILYDARHNDCAFVNDTQAATVANISVAGTEEVWLWADYTVYPGGSSTSRTLTHTSLAT
ncbi:MAG: hypothetical protein NT157_02890 [Candidatus Micrarchaeota archaeon]|nr:hypothetical protein [Candidatus Micrarchaeota archaeon]